MAENKILKVVSKTLILGKEINLYGSIESPLFLAKDVAEWIDYSKNPNGARQVSKMLKSVDDDEKLVVTMLLPDETQSRDYSVLTEDGLYEVCMLSRKPIAKQMKKKIKEYLHNIRATGAAIEYGREEDMVDYYLGAISEETKILILKEFREQNEQLRVKNAELQKFYDDLLNTEGLVPMNIVAKELRTGIKRLYSFLRERGIMFYKGKVNVPYQRFMEQGLFKIKEVPAHNGAYVPQTFATTKGIEYIRKIMTNMNYWNQTT